MKNDVFTQLTLWPEEDLPPELKVSPTDGEAEDPPQAENNKQKGESAYIQLSLPEFDEADLD